MNVVTALEQVSDSVRIRAVLDLAVVVTLQAGAAESIGTLQMPADLGFAAR